MGRHQIPAGSVPDLEEPATEKTANILVIVPVVLREICGEE